MVKFEKIEGQYFYEYMEMVKEWKESNKTYLREIQNFLDKADNIQDNELKQKIIGQMLRCDNILTQIAENRFLEFYELGYKNAKKE